MDLKLKGLFYQVKNWPKTKTRKLNFHFLEDDKETRRKINNVLRNRIGRTPILYAWNKTSQEREQVGFSVNLPKDYKAIDYRNGEEEIVPIDSLIGYEVQLHLKVRSYMFQSRMKANKGEMVRGVAFTLKEIKPIKKLITDLQ